MTCVAFLGGDLPTEAQWEYAASIAGRPRKALFPWGSGDPTCKNAVFGRGYGFGSNRCVLDLGVRFGPASITADRGRDVTPLGIRGLAGGVAEWSLDAGESYSSECWKNAPLVNPSCLDDDAPNRVVHGAHWSNDLRPMHERSFIPAGLAGQGVTETAWPTPTTGFRCAYRERPK